MDIDSERDVCSSDEMVLYVAATEATEVLSERFNGDSSDHSN